MIDTHTHIYLDELIGDIENVITRSKQAGVSKLLLPNVDNSTYDNMISIAMKYSGYCYPMIGLHPCSVKENFEQELSVLESKISEYSFCAIGEIGIDLYWDKTFLEQQKIALKTQLYWAQKYNLPSIIHVRNAHTETFEVLNACNDKLTGGIFHCFSGNTEQALQAIELGFYIGIGGVVTFKNSGLEKVVSAISLEKIVLETDAPYLAPVPHRGKRNEPAFLPFVAQKIAEIKNISVTEVIETTNNNVNKIFNF